MRRVNNLMRRVSFENLPSNNLIFNEESNERKNIEIIYIIKFK